jgi:topoisomerase-4 subunit B
MRDTKFKTVNTICFLIQNICFKFARILPTLLSIDQNCITLGANYKTSKLKNTGNGRKKAPPEQQKTKRDKPMQETRYTEDEIKSLDWREHIRLRPGMYIGKLGDGSSPEDGIYVLLKEVLDNSIDEYAMGYGKYIDVSHHRSGRYRARLRSRYSAGQSRRRSEQDQYRRQIRFSKAFKKSVGLNGVGTKAVNALSEYFKVTAIREGKAKWAEFQFGNLTRESKLESTKEENGTLIFFKPDNGMFRQFRWVNEYVEQQLWNYAYLNAGLQNQFQR